MYCAPGSVPRDNDLVAYRPADTVINVINVINMMKDRGSDIDTTDCQC